MDKRKILVIEDDPDIIKSLKVRLEASNFEVIAATSGKEGLKKAEEDEPELILLDIMLPDVSGFDVCESLKQNPETKDIFIIVVTAFGTPISESILRQKGIDDFIRKPYDSKDLLARIEVLFDRGKKVVSGVSKKKASIKKVLIVGNKSQFLETVERRLEADNYKIVTVFEGKDFSRKIKLERPDAVFLMSDFAELNKLDKAIIRRGSLPLFVIAIFSRDNPGELVKELDGACLLLKEAI